MEWWPSQNKDRQQLFTHMMLLQKYTSASLFLDMLGLLIFMGFLTACLPISSSFLNYCVSYVMHYSVIQEIYEAY